MTLSRCYLLYLTNSYLPSEFIVKAAYHYSTLIVLCFSRITAWREACLYSLCLTDVNRRKLKGLISTEEKARDNA